MLLLLFGQPTPTPEQVGKPGGGGYQPITFGQPEPIDLYDERLVLVLALT